MKYTKLQQNNKTVSGRWFDAFSTGADVCFDAFITDKKAFFCVGTKVLESYNFDAGLRMYTNEHRHQYEKFKKDFIYNFLPLLGADVRKKLIELKFFIPNN